MIIQKNVVHFLSSILVYFFYIAWSGLDWLFRLLNVFKSRSVSHLTSLGAKEGEFH